MLTDHAKLMQFFSEAKEVTGRKKLQKMIYILQKCDFPFEEKYQFHFYGPYSEELSLRTEELCNLGFLTERKEEKSNYFQYHYQITGDGLDFLRQFQMDMPEMTEQIAMLKEKSSRFLELVSTILYFDGLSRDEAVEKVHTVKPKQNYSQSELDEAFRFIRTIRPLQ
ncbi:YwgA family protein [Lentibacillus cibarius]|uniref:YwgA family protein n=1 Tax=Lentibacillus cibarius TaxID=2583219 RepID=A0A549YFZ5_9BACI|nr:YwgA family protein [Lentibacillus cibarius]TMN22036.1 YwgA family protein [Lentibacillus cibarius]TRM10812.1 YwgA family protein [Lentibacillus cibarius]